MREVGIGSLPRLRRSAKELALPNAQQHSAGGVQDRSPETVEGGTWDPGFEPDGRNQEDHHSQQNAAPPPLTAWNRQWLGDCYAYRLRRVPFQLSFLIHRHTITSTF